MITIPHKFYSLPHYSTFFVPKYQATALDKRAISHSGTVLVTKYADIAKKININLNLVEGVLIKSLVAKTNTN